MRYVALAAIGVVALFGVVARLAAGSAEAGAIITVTTTSDELAVDGNCSLREAIMAVNTQTAVDGCLAGGGADTIIVPAGLYTLTIPPSDTDDIATGDLNITSDVTVNGVGAGSSVIQACDSEGGPCTGIDRVFDIDSGNATISRVTVRNGSVFVTGGGIRVAPGATLTLTNSTVSGNYANCYIDIYGCAGGGIYNIGALTVADSTLSGNFGSDFGGGIYNVGALTVTDSTLSGNFASHGGGIGNGGALTVTNSNLIGNNANCNTCFGGGIYNTNAASLENSTLSGNNANCHGCAGGGIGNGGLLTVTNSTLSDNNDNCYGCAGGGIANSGTATVTDSTLSGNSGSDFGGGILNDGATLTVTDSTLSGNSASYGGGIDNNEGMATLKNTIVADNLEGGNCAGTAATSQGYNLSSDASCAFAGPGDMSNTEPMLSHLADNGGPTQTQALLPGSPAIDAGSPDCPPPATDQRGIPRPQGSRCDIGAYEFVPPTITVSKVYSDGNTAPVTVTLACTSGTVSGNPASVAPGNPATFTITGFLAGATCSASEAVPAGYFENDDCPGHLFTAQVGFRPLALSDGANLSCTFTNNAEATVTVSKVYSNRHTTSPVMVTLVCTSGYLNVPSQPAAPGSPAVFEVFGFAAGANCTASELVPTGYEETDNCTSANLALTAGASKACTIVNKRHGRLAPG